MARQLDQFFNGKLYRSMSDDLQLTGIKNEKEFAYGSMRVALSGIRFFYTVTCKRKWNTLKNTAGSTGLLEQRT